MSGRTYKVVALLLILATFSIVSPAQAQTAPAAKPDSAAVKAHEDAARKAAGTEWQDAFKFWCNPDQKSANKPDDPVIPPTKIFDNLYAIGRTSTLSYALDTKDGIIMLDTGYANDVDTVLIPGLKELKLDPARIKHVIISHGHADHFGGAKALQDRFGAHVWVTAVDWDGMEQQAARGRGQPTPMPKRDMVIMENQPIVLGEEKVTPFNLPGHTPGTIALVFPVKDNGKTHMVGYLGAPMLIPPPDPAVQQHIQSLSRFGETAQKMKVDVEILNHPMMDNMAAKLAKLKERKGKEPNPFVVGTASYQRFLTVSEQCLQGVLVRRQEIASSK